MAVLLLARRGCAPVWIACLDFLKEKLSKKIASPVDFVKTFF
jgi:hypothetical protein